MFFTSRKQYLANDAREIHIGEDSKLPQLHRLCTDFGFAVIGLNESSATPKKYVLCEVGLVKGGNQSPEKASPEFASLVELETYTAENVVEIVQKYLFGDDNLTGDDSIAVA
ncbi:MAG: hypothetical protein ACRBCI_11180 [Cellvibrionaceae bacterium]